MGPYCNFCDKRCFVERRLPFKTGTLLMATCSRGMAHDRAKTAHDYTTAVNPSAVPDPVVFGPEPFEPALERARGLASGLEGQVAALADAMRLAHRLAAELVPACSCCDTDGPSCKPCQLLGLLTVDLFLNPAAADRLVDAALAGVSGE